LKTYLKRLFNTLFRTKDNNFKYRLYVFLACLGLSLILWLITKLSGEYETEIRFSVHYANFPEDKILVNATDSILLLRYEETGLKLFELKYLTSRPSIVINLNNMALKKEGDKYNAHLLTSHMVDYISKQLKISEQLVSISPDTLYFIFEERIEKSVPVKVDMQLDFAQQFRLYESVTYSPQSVMISGPASKISKIDTAYTQLIELSDLKEDQNLRVPLIKNADSKLRFIPDEIEISIQVQEFTEEEINVPLRILNNHGWEIKLFPETINIAFFIALRDYNKVSPEMFTAVADFSEVDFESDKKVNVQIISSPRFVTVNKVYPDKVEFILLK